MEMEDDSTSSDSYTEKVPSFIILEKFNKITEIIKDLNEKCNYNYNIYNNNLYSSIFEENARKESNAKI